MTYKKATAIAKLSYVLFRFDLISHKEHNDIVDIAQIELLKCTLKLEEFNND
jgi:hypothetical protein